MATASPITEPADRIGRIALHRPTLGWPLLVCLATARPRRVCKPRSMPTSAAAFGGQRRRGRLRPRTACPTQKPLSEPAQPLARPTTPTARHLTPGSWLLSAADYLNTYKLMGEHNAAAAETCLLLGTEVPDPLIPQASCSARRASALAGAPTSSPPRTTTCRPRGGLVNSSILYPMSRARSIGTRPRYPRWRSISRMSRFAWLERLAAVAQRCNGSTGPARRHPLARSRGCCRRLHHRRRARGPSTATCPQPESHRPEYPARASIGGSLFADVEAKATFWQRARLAYSPRAAAAHVDEVSHRPTRHEDVPAAPDVQPMIDSFRLAYTNLRMRSGRWSCRRNSLLGLKKLSLMPLRDLPHARRRCGPASSTTSSSPTVCAPSIAATCSARSRRFTLRGSPRT